MGNSPSKSKPAYSIGFPPDLHAAIRTYLEKDYYRCVILDLTINGEAEMDYCMINSRHDLACLVEKCAGKRVVVEKAEPHFYGTLRID